MRKIKQIEPYFYIISVLMIFIALMIMGLADEPLKALQMKPIKYMLFSGLAGITLGAIVSIVRILSGPPEGWREPRSQ